MSQEMVDIITQRGWVIVGEAEGHADIVAVKQGNVTFVRVASSEQTPSQAEVAAKAEAMLPFVLEATGEYIQHYLAWGVSRAGWLVFRVTPEGWGLCEIISPQHTLEAPEWAK